MVNADTVFIPRKKSRLPLNLSASIVNQNPVEQTPEQKKKYWQGRMTERVKQSMKEIDWMPDEVRSKCSHVGIDTNKGVNAALSTITVGFQMLLNAINQVSARTKEGLVDLGSVK